MNEVLVKNWNNTVSKDDIVYHLGDVAFGDNKNVKNFVQRLQGRKMLILGNHDRYKPTEYMNMGFEWASRFPIIFNGFYILSHEPIFLEANSPMANLYGHLHQNNYQSPNLNYYNCCVEQHDYKPVDFDEIVKHFQEIGFKSETVKIEDTNHKR
jgi:calcineurin-like phosphoesterase family protein